MPRSIARLLQLLAVLLPLALAAAPAARAEGEAAKAAVIDFDAFWAKRLEECRAVPLRATIKPLRDEEGVAVSTVFYDSVKKVRIHGYLAVPAGGGKHPGLVIIPGLGDHARPEWVIEAARHGFTTLMCDLRGQGQSKGSLPDVVAIYLFTTPEEHFIAGCIADVQRAVDLLAEREEVDAKWLFVEGFSLGGGLTISVSALDSRIRAAAIGAPAFCDFEHTAREANDPRMSMLRSYLAGMPDQELAFRQLGFVDNSNFAARLKIPVLFGMSTHDPTVDYAGVKRAYERIPGGQKEFIEGDAPRHVPPAGFFEKAEELFRRVMGEEPM